MPLLDVEEPRVPGFIRELFGIGTNMRLSVKKCANGKFDIVSLILFEM
jgi:hypothetical protein